jgi:hypothetical protein
MTYAEAKTSSIAAIEKAISSGLYNSNSDLLRLKVWIETDQEVGTLGIISACGMFGIRVY